MSQELLKIVCRKCQHWIRATPKEVEKYEANVDDFKCELCWIDPKKPRRIEQYHECSRCFQVYASTGTCECPEEVYKITATYDPDNKWTNAKKLHEDVAGFNAKTDRLVHEKFRDKRLEVENRNKHVEDLLVETVGLLKKLVKKN